MLDNLKKRLQQSTNFPSPPAIALQIIALAGEPDVDLARVAAAISKDPGLTAKILRVANSPLYSKRRKSENLRQALVNLGLNSAMTLALSFSLLTTYAQGKGTGIDYTLFGRRAMLAASAARALGVLQGARALEDLLLAALLQDIAVLAIDRAQSDFYTALPANVGHAALAAHERALLGMDHAALGGWLMRQWKLPESLCAVVEASHDPSSTDRESPLGAAARCVALSSECVEILLTPQTADQVAAIASHAQLWLGIEPAALDQMMTQLVAEIPDTERLFDTKLMAIDTAASMLDQARELLAMRTMQALDQVAALNENLADMESRTEALEDKHRRDPLTGVYNRGHLDEVLEKEYQAASTGGWPLSVLFADLDRFKSVNDTYGHAAGDTVLRATAAVLLDVMRDEDCVARYGGEEFVIVLPGIGTDAAQKIANRLLARLRDCRHAVPGASVQVTSSLGLATHSPGTPFASAAELMAGADRAVYAAKKTGRDRLCCTLPDKLARTA